MKSKILYTLFFVIIFLSFSYGFAVGKYKFFPYKQLFAIKQFANEDLNERNREYRIEIFEKFSPSVEIVLIGDSITEYGEWNDFFPSKKLSNRGVAGDTTKDVILRMDSIYTSKARKAFLMIGINDIYANLSINRIVENYKKIISSLKDKNFVVIAQSTIQCQLEICGTDRVAKVNLLNKELENLGKAEDIIFLNLGELSSENGLNKDFTYDGIHLNALGYRYWVSKIDSKFNYIN